MSCNCKAQSSLKNSPPTCADPTRLEPWDEDNESHDCFHTFELHSNQLCKVGFWGGFGILIFVIAIILAVYFAIGIILNRCRGAQGKKDSNIYFKTQIYLQTRL